VSSLARLLFIARPLYGYSSRLVPFSYLWRTLTFLPPSAPFPLWEEEACKSKIIESVQKNEGGLAKNFIRERNLEKALLITIASYETRFMKFNKDKVIWPAEYVEKNKDKIKNKISIY
jgi:hypothetical protein